VKKQRFCFGAILYEEKNVYKAAKIANALDDMYPAKALPRGFKNPVLIAFANAAWHCDSAAQVAIVFNKAAEDTA